MNELKEIEALVAKYFDLLYFGDTSLISECFWPQATVNSVESGQVISIDMNGFADRLEGRPAPSSIDENRINALKLIELESPTTALLKVEVQILGDRYHDYLTLMKCSDEWKIICKVFHRF
ncbi:MAG: nuclear transport factor 2 family protein [Gammaproteobacteria bacterium]|nr:nuclear transport factor 2 family protein [Gammaproteobacteria bacterium]MDE0282398.1 nuclear transport factor 2 family protein [Gammaproteobacteria bacterium]MYH91599.1 nuclear transport factor 2 family protein [Gammaproteobacteria bacterium]